VTPEWESAVKRGDATGVAAQIAAGADVDALDRYGQSALMLAAHRGHLEVVRLLVRAGVDLDRTAKFRLSALMLAVIGGH
jgi:ankyrin repeat protein